MGAVFARSLTLNVNMSHTIWICWFFGMDRNLPFVVWLLELGLGSCSPRFVAWPLELELENRIAHSTTINRSTVFALHCVVLPCVPIKMQVVGILDFTFGYSTIVYVTFLFLTLPCLVLTYKP